MSTHVKRGALAVALALIVAPSVWSEEKAPVETAAAKQEAPAGGPKIAFDKETIDIGDIVRGEKAKYTFTFKNAGTADLEIKAVRPSCGCTVAEHTKLVKPGETGQVVATIDTARFKGPITKTVTVESNDAGNGRVTLQAKGNVRVTIDVQPSENVYFRIFRGDETPTKRVLTITSEAEQPFEIGKVESSNPSITTNLVPLGKEAQGDQPARGGHYQLELDVKKDVAIGPLNGTVTLTTTNPKVPTIQLTVSGQVLGDVIVTPPKVYLGAVTKETAAAIKRTVRVERRSGNGFKIESVDSSNPAFKADLATVEEGKVYTVTISIASELAAGAVNANILLKTNDKDQPTIQVPVIGTVQGSTASSSK